VSGGVPRQVLEGVLYAGADFSPDGKDFAVAHVVDGKARLEFPIGKVLVSSGADTLRVSPTGDAIAFWEVGDVASISIIDREGKSKKTISKGWDPKQYAGVPCWSSDGKEIWFTAAKPGKPGGLWAVDRSGRERLIMRVPGDLELDDISRDGRVLLAHHTQLHLLRGLPAGETKQRELSWLDHSEASDLTPDGKTIVITELGEGSGRTPVAYLRSTDGAPALRLGEGFGYAISPDGKWVLASIPRGPGNGLSLGLLPTGPGETRILETGELTEFDWGGWLPDGTRVVFSGSSSASTSRLYLMDASGGKPRAIGPDGVSLMPFTNPVSPDGRSVFGVRSGKTWIYPVDGGEPTAIPGLAEGDHVLQWTLDGRSLYVSRRELPLQVFLVDLKTGVRRLWKEIPTEGVSARARLRITPDGKSYAYGGLRVFSELYVVDGLR
jgi:hypothetical protein